MGKKMLNTTVLKSTDSQRVGIKEILSIENNDGSYDHRKHPKQPSLREIVIEGFKSVNSRFNRLEADVADLKVRMTKVEVSLQEHGKQIATLSTKLDTVIKLNNLKTE